MKTLTKSCRYKWRSWWDCNLGMEKRWKRIFQARLACGWVWTRNPTAWAWWVCQSCYGGKRRLALGSEDDIELTY